MPRPDTLRWVMARGRYEFDQQTGNLYGRGIAIDITESKLDGHADDQVLYLPALTGCSPLEQAVEHALEARTAIDQLGGKEGRTLWYKVNELLLALGRMLAKAMRYRN